ncbi:FeoB small GTPase domain-containing protein [Acetomicrobium sp.]|jgi:ferrous iron transport protein B|uniref:FeoB small GTPase domain-containing protein n=1 Tax=Acetomicrobium sp. TaxID=1872099 RepID=UPI003D959A4E
MTEIVVAVAGQPNSGKSTLFNMLTGMRQFVANYPGVTVEKRVGRMSYKGYKFMLVDLPGTYSMTSYSLEERIARNFLLKERPNIVLDVVDASNLERNLVLTFQLLEMKIPMVVVLNMMDAAESARIKIDVNGLSEELGVKVVPTMAKRGVGKAELCDALLDTYQLAGDINDFRLDYGPQLNRSLNVLQEALADDERASAYDLRWLAVRLIAGDEEVSKLFTGSLA